MLSCSAWNTSTRFRREYRTRSNLSISKFIGQPEANPHRTHADPNFNRRHEARFFENSRRRLPLVTESQIHGSRSSQFQSCRDKKYGYAVDAASTQFRMHPVRVASFKKYESLNDHENDTVLFFSVFSFFFSSLSLSLHLIIQIQRDTV